MEQQTEQYEVPGDSERLLALFAHLSFFFGSLILPLIFWAVNGGKSKFLSFHALQSLFFHIIYTVVLIFIALFAALVGIATGLIKPGSHHQATPDAFQIIVIIALGVVVLGIVFGCVALAIINAISAYKGGMKKYPIIGNIIYKKVYGLN